MNFHKKPLSHFVAGAAISLALSACGNNDSSSKTPTQNRTQNQTIKQFDIPVDFKPCKTGIVVNGKQITHPDVSAIKHRFVKQPENIKAAYKDGEGFFYTIQIANRERGTTKNSFACSADLLTLASWACGSDRTFDGLDCEVTETPLTIRKINEHCEITNLAVSGPVFYCRF